MSKIYLIILVGAAMASIVTAASVQPDATLMAAGYQGWYGRMPNQLLSQSSASVSR